MRMKLRVLAPAALLLLPFVAQAQDKDRDYCPERPGLGTPACTIDPGRVSVETGLADWTRTSDGSSREDDVLIGDSKVRVGLSDTVEAQIGWTPYGHVRTRDTATDAVSGQGSTGDVSLGIKANLAHPDGSGFAIAILPYVTLPVGGSAIGAGDWGAGLVLPVSYELSDTVSAQFTGEADAAVNASGSGRHLAYSGTAGLGFGLTEDLTFTLEGQLLRDEEPSGATTQALASASFGWMRGKDMQFDLGAVAGLNRNSPDVELYFGVARRF